MVPLSPLETRLMRGKKDILLRHKPKIPFQNRARLEWLSFQAGNESPEKQQREKPFFLSSRPEDQLFGGSLWEVVRSIFWHTPTPTPVQKSSRHLTFVIRNNYYSFIAPFRFGEHGVARGSSVQQCETTCCHVPRDLFTLPLERRVVLFGWV